MKRRPSSLYAWDHKRRTRAVGVLAAALAAGVALFAVGSSYAADSASSVTVPTTINGVAQSGWSGTIPMGGNVSSNCGPLADTPAANTHALTIDVPAGAYDAVDAFFTFTITWEDDADDEILTVVDPDGNVVQSSDGGSNVETVNAKELAPGTYKVVACAFASTNEVPYTGKVVVTAEPPEASLPSASPRGLEFSASVATDPQRDQAEPLIEIDKAGNVYDCGPSGSSQLSDYAQVSPPNQGGDQFHMLGTPPRGQQSLGGGGDCGLAFSNQRNDRGNYTYAYTGLGPLTGFATSSSPNNGKTLTTGGPAGNLVTDTGVLADRQWMTFVDPDTVLLIYNQQQPRNVVVQRSDNSGLTYGNDAVVAAANPRFPGPIRYVEPRTGLPNGLVYFPWDRGDRINISFSTDRGLTWKSCGASVTPGEAALFPTADHDTAGNIYIVYGENARFHTYMVTTSASKLNGPTAGCIDPAADPSEPPLRPALFSAPMQVDRAAVRSTVFQWVTAGGAPGRVAVAFAGTETDGDPNTGSFKATWHIYVSQSLNATSTSASNPPTFAQVQATTHPFHYDSICLNGLGCDISVPPGDRSMADFFALDYNPVDKKIYITFNRSNKKPDEAIGHVASPMVVTQIAGPSNGGGTIRPNRPVLRQSSNDPAGDALSSYSILLPPLAPHVDPATANEPAADFRSISIGPELDLATNTQVANGGFTATVKVSDLSALALMQTAAQTGSQSLLWVLRFTNGHQDAAAVARWNRLTNSFTFGYNDFTTGDTPCVGPGTGANEKCIVFPGDTEIQGDVNQVTGTIRLSVPRSLLRGLSGGIGHGQRPSEVGATVGTRFYDATMFSLGSASLDPNVESFLYPLDNTPSMDFLLPRSNPGGGGNQCASQTDSDGDGLTDSNELLFLTLLNLPDSDFDGTKDGNDDANRNGEDDEDEDDGDECPDRDDDGDGEDDEDEDDDD